MMLTPQEGGRPRLLVDPSIFPGDPLGAAHRSLELIPQEVWQAKQQSRRPNKPLWPKVRTSRTLTHRHRLIRMAEGSPATWSVCTHRLRVAFLAKSTEAVLS